MSQQVGPMSLLPDTYTRRAQLRPALFVALPLALCAIAYFSSDLQKWAGMWTAMWTLLIWCGGIILFAQLGRDMGRRKQDDLYKQWGGKPTTKLLRHRDAENQVALQRRHQRLQQLMPDIKLPSPSEERENPEAADEIYETCSAFLREQTRDTKEFRLVFEENCNYGFRRNLWGMKPVGIVISVIGIAVITALIILDQCGIITANLPTMIACGTLIMFSLLGWLFLFKPSWVRIPADAYAIQLIGAVDKLEPPKLPEEK